MSTCIQRQIRASVQPVAAVLLAAQCLALNPPAEKVVSATSKAIDLSDDGKEKDARDAKMPSTGLSQNGVQRHDPVAKWLVVPDEPAYVNVS